MVLDQDIIKVDGKKIFINPFLYAKKFDSETNKWLREAGQVSKSIIDFNRSKFYPEVDWDILSSNETRVKEATIELFVKTIEIIKTFNHNLNYENLLAVEQHLIQHKKFAFEKKSRKYLWKKERLFLKEKRRVNRADFLHNWQKWLSLKETQKLLVPLFVIIFSSALIGWFAGVSKNSCNPYFESISSNNLKNNV
tara:strand:+ start:108 stop:692 length:585 start_codon:yes stop_codon:yes gene_type:complete